jgi:hypothetical protein
MWGDWQTTLTLHLHTYREVNFNDRYMNPFSNFLINFFLVLDGIQGLELARFELYHLFF